jgi:hypothetical protein
LSQLRHVQATQTVLRGGLHQHETPITEPLPSWVKESNFGKLQQRDDALPSTYYTHLLIEILTDSTF